ncbi:efflux RND transporter periplasmic adaptor subunit [Gallaecimonas mangrovi]|uniref:efflux RND transporter periplasmic adaptor subunit n=1 Tax=Gallaecimonas mangrovi TaxID=2291597 RepID=UPI000E1FEF27|nr:efflux RND transporter periplasmic adaptor subunit [Gallaecimonas mangrovi]
MSSPSRLMLTSLLLLAGCSPQAQTAATKPQPPVVTVAKVIKKPINEWDQYTGRLQAPQQVNIRPRVSGYIDKVAFSEGSLVKKGDLLFQIDPRPYAAEVARLQAQLQSAQVQAKQASAEANRAKHLKNSAMSAEQADARESAAQTAIATVKATAAALEAAKLSLEFTDIRAPVAGRVSRAYITAGNLVTAGSSLLTTLVSTQAIYAYFDADEQRFIEYSQRARDGLRQGTRDPDQVVMMGLAGSNNYPFIGHIDFVDNQINAQTGTIRARAVFDNHDGLLTPGMFARIRWASSKMHPALLIKDVAVGTDLGKKYVLVMDAKHQLSYRNVTLGPRLDSGLRVVTQGLTDADTIVVNGLQRVRPGVTVTPETEPMASPAQLQQLARSNGPQILPGAATPLTAAR